MKLVVAHQSAWKRYVTREFSYIMTELTEAYGWKQIDPSSLWNNPRDLRDILLRQFGELPDDVLFWEGYDLLTTLKRSLDDLNCRVGILADDLHWWDEQMRLCKSMGLLLADIVFSTYEHAFHEFYPSIARTRRVVWVPHSASPDFMLAFNERPANALLLSGAVDKFYPLRQQLARLSKREEYPIVWHRHPGYHCEFDYAKEGSVGRRYAELINAHRAGFTDSSKFKYVVAKYFEIPATGALLLADNAVGEALKRLGFVENVHYVPVSGDDLEERVRYVLDENNHSELDGIRKRGQELVWKEHTTGLRAGLIDESFKQGW